MKKLLLLSGTPGSGKSTWANQYKATHENVFIVSSDDIRAELFGKPNDFRNEKLVWATYLNRINEYSKKYDEVTVIADATNLQNQYRRMYYEGTPGFEWHTLVVFNIPFEICLKQNKLREIDRVVPEEAMARLKAEYEVPSQEIIDLYDETLVIENYYAKDAIIDGDDNKN
ncbi:MAG: AAA family ATPase [Bacilli bacterium]|nr:AAA family ATPase [Bacilli bacterium]